MAVSDWSTTAASNATQPGINWAEGQPPSSVNDSARQMMADIATWYASAGSAGPYAASGSNSDITSLTGITTPLSIAQGGTNSATAAAALTALGASAATPADNVFAVVGSSDATKKLAFEVDTNVPTGTTLTVTPGNGGILPAGIGPLPYSGSSIPTGWLECDGSAISRTTYAALFTAIGTTWGVGDGSTTFNLPPGGRVYIGDGTATTVEAVTASSSNGFTVSSNNTKWITGMAVVLSNLSGFTTSATAGPTYYAVRISATNVRLATTLALAQNNTPDVTISGTGTATLTTTFTARTLGQIGGEEAHAQSITELLLHVHPTLVSGAGVGSNFATGSTGSTNNTGSAGGNAAMNIMQPFAVTKMIISY